MIAIACDHGGLSLKNSVVTWLKEWDYQVQDFGVHSNTSVDYPDYAVLVGKAVVSGECSCGILICGTGIGMAISANKVAGVRAANVENIYSARMFREHNNGNVLCLGARISGIEIAKEIVKSYLSTEFSGGRHERRVNKMMAIENRA